MTTKTPTKGHDIAALEALYVDAEGCDQEVFAEMRSNILLIAGDHYNKNRSSFYKRLKDTKDLNEQQKLRLTKNHVQKIVKTYANNITSLLPGVGFEPKNDSELQDLKAAELHHSVWMDAHEKQNLDEKNDDWCDDFLGVGEVATKIFWDPSAGELVGYHQAVGDDGQPLHEETGQTDPMGNPVPGAPVADESRPQYSGDFVLEDIYGFNLLRAPEAKSMKKSPYLISRKMTNKDDLLKQFGDDPDKEKFIKECQDETYVVFDASRGGYRKSKNEVLVKEYFFRPGPQYPLGYFYITTKEGILAEGELPGGVFPIVWQYFDRVQTTPRGRGPVKVMRPYQAEINRAASKIAEHQITLGDDKLLIQNGTKISAGVALPGVRSINYTGMEPAILNGRDGSQYLAYMQAQIAEMYMVMNVAEDSEQAPGQLDPFALLFRAASQKKKFQRYIKRYERFLVDVAKTYIKLAKIHMPDEAVVYAVGKKERVNISEFRNSDDICYQVKISSQSEDIETKMGKQMVMNHVLQYVGPQLDKESVGKILRSMPYTDGEEAWSDLTIDYDAAVNDILALDRGELPPVHEYDTHPYMINKLMARKRKADYKYLPPQIQANYDNVLQQHEQAEVLVQQKIQAAKNEYIPADGYMVVCDLYVTDPANPDKTRRARIPYNSLAWLIKQLETQGQSLEQLESMNQGAVAQMADMGARMKGGQPNGMGQPPQMGAGMPRGAVNHGRPNQQPQPAPGSRPPTGAGQPAPGQPPSGPGFGKVY